MRDRFVKVCGLTQEEQIDWAIELGYDAIGVLLVPWSKRYRPPARAVELAAHARGRIRTFAVGMTYAEVADVADAFDTLQLYEPADVPSLALATATPPPASLKADYVFYDASVGSGVFHDIPDWVADVPGRLVLAGGLDASNVAEVIERFDPYGVDVSSGVENGPGDKNYDKMAAFLAAVRNA